MEPLTVIIIMAFGFGAGSIFGKKPSEYAKPAPIVQEQTTSK